MAKELKLETRISNASALKRSLAFIADLLVLNLVIGLPFRRLLPKGDFKTLKAMLNSSPALLAQLSRVYMFMGLLAFCYFTFSEYRLGQSIGKAMLGIQVISNNKRASMLQIALRNVFLFPVFPFVLLWLLDPISLFLTKRRLSDILTNTRVIAYETGIKV